MQQLVPPTSGVMADVSLAPPYPELSRVTEVSRVAVDGHSVLSPVVQMCAHLYHAFLQLPFYRNPEIEIRNH